MTRNIVCRCGKCLGFKILETQEVTLSMKSTVMYIREKDIKIQCGQCGDTYTEVGILIK